MFSYWPYLPIQRGTSDDPAACCSSCLSVSTESAHLASKALLVETKPEAELPGMVRSQPNVTNRRLASPRCSYAILYAPDGHANRLEQVESARTSARVRLETQHDRCPAARRPCVVGAQWTAVFGAGGSRDLTEFSARHTSRNRFSAPFVFTPSTRCFVMQNWCEWHEAISAERVKTFTELYEPTMRIVA